MLLFAKNIEWHCDVRNLQADAILFRKILCKKKYMLILKSHIQHDECLNKVKFKNTLL